MIRDVAAPLRTLGGRLELWMRVPLALRLLGGALLVGLAYFLGVQLGLAFRLPGTGFSPIWPPIAVLLAVLLLSPARHWWIWLLAAIPAHLLVYLPLDTPLWRQSVQIAHNLLMVLPPALILRRAGPEAVRLSTFGGVLTFLLTVSATALLVPVGAAAIYAATGVTDSFWQMWQLIAFSNILVYLTLLPATLLTVQHGHSWLRGATWARAIEVGLLAAGLLVAGELVFGVLRAGPASGTYIRMATLPLLLWSAVRFGPGGLSLGVTAMMLVAIWNAALGQGPFSAGPPTQNVINVTSYFLTFAGPLLLLAALMTDRRRTEAALVQLNADLEDRVVARTAELAQANAELEIARDAAEAASRAKSAFLATMSHELRTPLHTIIAYNRLMLGSAALPPEQREHALAMQHGGEHLLTLINNLLDVARIEAGKHRIRATTVDLPRLLDDLREMFRRPAENKGLVLRCAWTDELPREVRVDAVKLRQVLINLLDNAVKFTPSGSVVLEAYCDPGDGWGEGRLGLCFEVADTGPGIAAEEQPLMFDAFVQTEAGRRIGEGTGLGLAISREFVLLLGGELSVRSTPGHGATFTARMPVEVPGMAARAVVSATLREGAGTTLERAALAALPAELLAALERAALAGEPRRLAAVAEEVGAHDRALAATLRQLVDRVAFESILAAVRGVQRARGSDDTT
jgi:signal transduction histidine kinase